MSKRKDKTLLFSIHFLLTPILALASGILGVVSLSYSSAIFGIFAMLVFIATFVNIIYAVNLICDSNDSKKEK